MAAVDAIADMACDIKPDEATLVPEKRQELTTEGGLDVVAHEQAVGRIVQRLQQAGIEVSLFIDPDARQVDAAQRLGVQAIEFQTASYSEARTPAAQANNFKRFATQPSWPWRPVCTCTWVTASLTPTCRPWRPLRVWKS